MQGPPSDRGPVVPEQPGPPGASRRELEARLRASEERMRALVAQVADYAILALDPQGRIQTWNLGAERVKGWTAEEVVGRSFEMFYLPEDRESGLPQLLLAQAREQGRVEHRGWRVRKDGTRFWGEVLITALHDERGALTGFAKVTRDRSDLKAVEEAQDAFYAGFLHDFRTPVTTITGFAEALRDADDDTREFLVGRIQANAERLMGMVDGLVRFAQVRRSHADLAVTRVEVGAVARSVRDDLSQAQGPGRVHVDDGQAWVLGDPEAVRRVLTNLVVNAVRYGGPEAAIRITFATPSRGRTRVTVADEGRGIHPDDLPTIFDSFQRGRLAREDGGTGLGLTSVRDLVRQQGGSVSIESVLGEGTRVHVELPAPAGAPAVGASSPEATRDQPSESAGTGQDAG